MNTRPNCPPQQSQPVLIALLFLISSAALLLVPALTEASAPAPAIIPLFNPGQFTQQQLADSTMNDGIPDVWKLHYGLSITDPAVTNADYNSSGLANAEKYHFNVHPLEPATS